MFADTKAFSGFAVDDLQKARAFYADTLGLRVSMEDEMPLMTLHLAGDRDTLVYEKADHAPANYTILNFAVDDVETAVDALAARGVAFERYEGFDQDAKGISRGQGPDIAWFTDPGGNVLAVLEM
jgi:catechol 2,3-dioxygenase-like lactoylglutathione lyase family enzyme